MIIKIEKFGKMLISREDGREAYSAIQSALKNINNNKNIEIDLKM